MGRVRGCCSPLQSTEVAGVPGEKGLDTIGCRPTGMARVTARGPGRYCCAMTQPAAGAVRWGKRGRA